MSFFVLGVLMGAQEVARLERVGGGVTDRVELMIAHDDVCGADVGHRLDGLEHLELSRPAVDQVAHEHRGAFGMPVDAGVVAPVSELHQQSGEFACAAVDVADDVVLGQPVLQSGRRSNASICCNTVRLQLIPVRAESTVIGTTKHIVR